MYKLHRRLAYLSVMVLIVLVGCQNAMPSQQASGTINQAKVSSALDKYAAASEGWGEEYANLSVPEMKAFIDLNHQRELQQLERNAAVERPVYFDAQGREIEEYDPAGRFETRRATRTEEELSERRAQIEQDYSWRLELHRVSVERHGVSYNALNGKQLDELYKDVPPGGEELSIQQACRYPASAFPRSGSVPYVGAVALPRSLGYSGTIEDGGCDYLYGVSGTASVTQLSQNPSAGARCISRVSGMGMVSSYARRRAANATTSRYILGPKSRIDILCGGAPQSQVNFANSSRAR